MREHKDPPNLTCDICQLSFATPFAIKNHRKLHERDESGGSEVVRQKNYVCEICGYRCDSKSVLTGHMTKHSGEPDPFKCNNCDMQFSNASRLQSHKRSHSKFKEKSFVCRICGKRFYRPSGLKTHHYVYHVRPEGRKRSPYVKTPRPKEMADGSARMQRGMIQYACLFCPKQFSHKGLFSF